MTSTVLILEVGVTSQRKLLINTIKPETIRILGHDTWETNLVFIVDLTATITRDFANLTGLETYFFSNSQTFASGFNFNSQIAGSYSQLVLLLFQILEIDSLDHAYPVFER